MKNETINKITPKDILIEEYNKCLKALVLAKVEIDFFNQLPDRQAVAGKKTLNAQGTAFENVSVEEMQKGKEEIFKILTSRFDIICFLLDEKNYKFPT